MKSAENYPNNGIFIIPVEESFLAVEDVIYMPEVYKISMVRILPVDEVNDEFPNVRVYMGN